MIEREWGSNFCEELQVCDKRLDDGEGLLFFDTGRSALRYLLDHLTKGIERVMLPQYDCGSVLEPFKERGFKIVYYPVNRHFELLRHEFEKTVKEERPQLILVQSYFGMDTLGKDRIFLNDLREKGILIIEDITHSIFAENWVFCADFKFGSLRKWCSVPDGGVLTGLPDAFPGNLDRNGENTEFVKKRLEAQKKKRDYFTGKEGSDKSFISAFDESENLLDRQRDSYTMSEYTRKRMPAVDFAQIVSRRRKNYSILRDALKNIPGIETIFYDLPANSTPLYFPVYVHDKRRDHLRFFMREMNIFLPVIWPVPSLSAGTLTPEVNRIYNEILAVPCDQRYTEQDMLCIADRIAECMRRTAL